MSLDKSSRKEEWGLKEKMITPTSERKIL